MPPYAHTTDLNQLRRAAVAQHQLTFAPVCIARREEYNSGEGIVISLKNDWKRIFSFETTNEGGSDE